MRAEADTLDDVDLSETVFRPVESLPPASAGPAACVLTVDRLAHLGRRGRGDRARRAVSWGIASLVTGGRDPGSGTEASAGTSGAAGGSKPPATGGDDP